MKCPYCGAEESKVIDSRPTEDSERIRRRRECLNCHMRFTTYEVVETVPLIVIKKDNSREPFDRQKLLNAMLRACAKRPVSYESLERAVSSIPHMMHTLISSAMVEKACAVMSAAESPPMPTASAAACATCVS